MTSERPIPDLVPDEGGPEEIKAMADVYAARARTDREELVRRDRSELGILAGHLERLDGFPMVKVVVIGNGGKEQEREEPLLFVDAIVSDGHGGYKLYLDPNGVLSSYRWNRDREGILEEGLFDLQDFDYIQYGQRAIEAAGARIKEVLAAKAVQTQSPA